MCFQLLQFKSLYHSNNKNAFLDFRRNFAWNNISTKFPSIFVTAIVLICVNFQAIIRSSRKVAAIFCMKIRSSRKFAAINRTIFCSSIGQKCFRNTGHWVKYINDLSKHRAQKKPFIFCNNITCRRTVSYNTHLVISQGKLNCWLDPKRQMTTVLINTCTCS